MNKTISINLGGRNFYIEEDAFKKLDAYLNAIKARFAEYAGSAEIVADMEARIGEKFADKYKDDANAVIVVADVDNLIAELGTVEDIAGEQGGSGQKTSSESFAPKRLMRNGDDKIVAGVCSGLAAYFNVDPIIFRGVFGILIFAWGAIIPIYFVLWLIMPEAKTSTDKMQMRGKAFNLDNINDTIKERAQEFKQHVNHVKASNMKGDYTKTKEEWKQWGKDLEEDIKKKFDTKYQKTPENSDTKANVADEPVESYPQRTRGGFSNFLRQIFQGIGKIIVFFVKILSKLIGVILILAFAIAIAGTTIGFAVAIFNANSPYLGLPLASLPHTAIFYLLLVTAYVIVLIPLLLLLLVAVSIFSHGRTGMNIAAFSSLFGVWILALVVGGSVGARYVPGYVDQIKNSPQLQTVTKSYFDLGSFDKVSLGNSIDYKLVQGKEFSVKATGRAMDLDRITVTVDNGTLNVSRGSMNPCIFCISGNDTVEITAPTFAAISASNSSSVKSESITATSTSLSLSNSSEADIRFIAQDLSVNLSNSSDANLSGTTKTLKAELHNSSDLKAGSLVVQNADVTTTNSSDAYLNIIRTLKYATYNSSQIYYTGKPQIITESGTGEFDNPPLPENP